MQVLLYTLGVITFITLTALCLFMHTMIETINNSRIAVVKHTQWQHVEDESGVDLQNLKGVGRGVQWVLTNPPLKLKIGCFLSSINTKYNSLHRSNTVENPHPHIMLIKSPVKSSATKIIYALDLANTRDAQQKYIGSFL